MRTATRRGMGLRSAAGTVAALPALVGCSENVRAGEAKQAGPVTLRVHLRSGVDGTFYKERLANEFAAAQPRITVQVEDFPGTADEYFTKVFAMHNTGSVGDVIWSNLAGGRFMSWSYNGIFAPVDDVLRTARVDTKVFFPAALTVVTFEDKRYGLPLKAAVGQALLQYNALLLDAAGVPRPAEAWATVDLVEHARRLNVGAMPDGKAERCGLGAPQAYNGLVETLRAFGGDLLSADGKKSLLATKEAGDAVQ